MAYAPTVLVYPSERRSLGIAKEASASPGTGVLPTATVPVKGFVPEDKITALLDESLRSAMAGVYGYTPGPYVADITIDSSPVYGDTLGYFLYSILGDYTATGTTTGTNTTINNVSGYPAGTTGMITVASGTSFSSGAPGFVQIGTGTSAEVVAYSTAASTTITLTGTTRFAHANSAPVTQVTGPYTHVFSLLNGTGTAQPPTFTLTDNNYLNSVLARWYPFFRVSELQLTGNAEQLLSWSCKGMGFANQVPGSVPTVSVSAVADQPAWNSQVGVGGTVSGSPVYNCMEWEYTLTREVQPYWSANGQQNPYTIGVGKFSCTAKTNWGPAAIQSALSPPYNAADWELLEFLNNAQPQMQVIATNGLSSTNLVKVQIDTQVAAFSSAVIEPSKALLGFNSAIDCVANTVNVGNSAGYGPIQVSLINNVPTF